jgi:hypothetical protein
MTRCEWNELPTQVREAIEDQCGPVAEAVSPDAGRNSEVSVLLRLERGHLVFCKGAHQGSRTHEHEARVNGILPECAPRLLWRVDVDGWLVLGFEAAPGDYADLSPNSPDLPKVAEAVRSLGPLGPGPTPEVPRLAEQWGWLAAWRRLAHDQNAELDQWTRKRLSNFVDLEAVAFDRLDGTNLAHTDLHPLNILVADRARVVDWAWSRLAAQWVDPALLVPRLVIAGHSPREAECWADQFPGWRNLDQETRTAFAVAVLGVWEHMSRADPSPHREQLTDVARQWVRHRFSGD